MSKRRLNITNDLSWLEVSRYQIYAKLHELTERAKVPGGLLYKVTLWDAIEEKPVAVALQFVPEVKREK